jgi:hypothetical protein
VSLAAQSLSRTGSVGGIELDLATSGQRAYKSSGWRPVALAILASMRGPISSRSWEGEGVETSLGMLQATMRAALTNDDPAGS